MLLFSSVALYLTSLWDKGFILPGNWVQLLQVVLLLAITAYLIVPLSRIVLFPIHILTFGLLSILCFMAMFYLLGGARGLISINPWAFPGFTLAGITIQKITFSYLGNLIAVATSTSVIINLLEKIT